MKGFWNDTDGFSSRDYLLILATGPFFCFWTIGMILSLLGKEVNQSYLALLDSVQPIIITMVTGLFIRETGQTVFEAIHKRNDPSGP